jgi:hypothetical protein
MRGRVDGQPAAHIRHQGADKAHVVDLAVPGVTAALAGVPGGKPAAGQLAVAIGKSHRKAFPVGLAHPAIAGIVGHVLGVATATVKGNDEGQRPTRRPAGRDVQQILPRQPAVTQAVLGGAGRHVGRSRLTALLDALPQPLAQAGPVHVLGDGGRAGQKQDGHLGDPAMDGVHEQPSTRLSVVLRHIGRGLAPGGRPSFLLYDKKEGKETYPAVAPPSGVPSFRQCRAGSSQTRPAGSNMRSPFSARHHLQSARQRGEEMQVINGQCPTQVPQGLGASEKPVPTRRAAHQQAGKSGAAV